MVRGFLSMVIAVGFAGSAMATEPPKPVEIMVLGAYHMSNPGLDLNNPKADDVLTPRRQREIAALVDELARFKPTRVMVERVGQGPELTPKSWTEFRQETLLSQRDETVQIAYRLASKLKIPVHGIDERDRPGEPSYWQFGKVEQFAKARGREGDVAALNTPFQEHSKKFEAAQATKPVAALMAMWNDPALAPRDMSFYYGTLTFSEGSDSPGADLNAQWYLRNARIFSNLVRLSHPGDRVLVLFGSGHGYWLRHFARETPGYVNVDVLPYLKRAAARR